MSCYCDSDDAPDIFESREIKARKQHTCCECNGKIEPGNTYEMVDGLWGGEWRHYRTCERCADLRLAVADVMCPAFTELFEDYEYLVGPRQVAKVRRRHRDGIGEAKQ